MAHDPDPGAPQGPAAHWLLLGYEPSANELEALIVSRELGVTWVDHRTLGWQPGVLLQGPLSDEELAGADLPEWVHSVYVMRCPRERGPAIPPELQLPGSVLTAFPDGEPEGVERQGLETLEALARRLGGGVLAENGVLVIPEPRLDLLLFTSTWVEPADLAGVLEGVAEFSGDGGSALPTGEEPPGYGLLATVNGGGVLSVSASEADVVPVGFTGYTWASGAVYVYELRYYPPQTFAFNTPLPTTPAEAEELLHAGGLEWIERMASVVLDATGGPGRGHLCDDDGFLVELP